MGRAFLALVLVCLLGAVAVGGELSGRVDFSFNVDPTRAIFNPQAVSILEYYLSDWTFGMVTEYGSSWFWGYSPAPLTLNGSAIAHRFSGLEDITFGVRGALGAFHLASYMFFGYNTPEFWLDDPCDNSAPPSSPLSISSAVVGQPRFLEWKNLAWTSIAGVDLWAMWGIDAPPVSTNGTTPQRIKPMTDALEISSLSGSTFGAHGVAGDLEVWAEVSFGAGHLIGLMPYWGYDLDYIASTWYYCDWGFGFAGDCSASFNDLWVIVTYPFGCGSLFSELYFDCSGFEFVSFAVRDIDLGVGWIYLDDFKVRFETASKSVWLDLELAVPEVFCIQPHVSWDLDLEDNDYSDTVIDGITLVGLTAEYSLDGITFLFAERFADPEVGDSEYASITTDARLWSRVSEREPSTYCEPNCDLLCMVDEAFGIEVDSDACCGGRMFGGVYVFFDHDLEDVSLFDWCETRAVVEYEIGPSFVVGMTGYFHHVSPPMLGFSFSYTWGTLRIFDHDFCDDCIRQVAGIS